MDTLSEARKCRSNPDNGRTVENNSNPSSALMITSIFKIEIS